MSLKKSIFWLVLAVLVAVASGCSHPSRPSHHVPHHLKNDVKNPTMEVAHINIKNFEV